MQEGAQLLEEGLVLVPGHAIDLGVELRTPDLHRVQLHQKARRLAVRVPEAKDFVTKWIQWRVHFISSEVHEVEDFNEGTSCILDCSHPQVLVFGVREDRLDLSRLPQHQSF